MEKRLLRNIEVSPIGMGCMGFSHGYGKVPSEDYSINAIRSAYDFGCTLFDTAETYGREQFFPGHNEQLVGKAIEPFRNNVVLATKLHISSEEYFETKDLEKIIRAHLSASMKNLKTDYIDLYYLHRYNEDIEMEPVAEVMGKLIKDGLIGGWGVSQVGIDLLKKAEEVTPVSAVQNLYNILERDCEQEILPYCLGKGIGVVPFSPIASGFLSGKVTAQTKFEGDDVRKFVPQLQKENLIANQPVLDILNKYATVKGATAAQISLAWMMKKYPNIVPIPGSKNKERIIENLEAWNIKLTDKEFADLEKALSKVKVYGHRGNEESQQKSFSHNWRTNA
ncbi:MAG: aldo/keto reductase [Clostridia bacterium]|nr:aldo/keto reductase [Clostridia bacterium]